MSEMDYTTKLLDMEDVIIEKFKKAHTLQLTIRLKQKPHACRQKSRGFLLHKALLASRRIPKGDRKALWRE